MSNHEKKFLVVDDDKMCRRILEVLLQQLGYYVDVAENASTAIELLSKNSYKLIFLDIGLPNTSGVELAQKIRMDFNLTLPIIATTGHVLKADHKRYINAGINIVLEKPIHLKYLKTVIVDHL